MQISLTSSFTFLMVIYYVTTMMFPTELYADSSLRLIPQSTMALVGLWCIYIIIMHIKTVYKARLLRPYLWMAVLMLVYVPWVVKPMTMFDNFIYFLKMSMALLVMMALYVMMLKRPKATQKSIFFLFFMQVVYVTYMLMLHRHLQIELSHNPHFNSNAGFTMICCVPMALMIPKKRLRVYVYLALVLGCLFGGQRSAALAALATFPFCWLTLRKSMKRSDYFIIAILAIVAMYPVIEMAIANFEVRNQMDAEGGTTGSGRSEFWAIAWNSFWSGHPLNILIGNGLNSVAVAIKRGFGMAIGAHNGWLDYMYTFGLFGLIIYARTVFCFFTRNASVNKVFPYCHNIFLIMGLLFLVKCTTSHGYWNIDVIPISMCMALIAAQSHFHYLKHE